jgi:hypothetical protein
MSLTGLSLTTVLAEPATPPLSLAVGALHVYSGASTGGIDVIPKTPPPDGGPGSFTTIAAGILVESLAPATDGSVVIAVAGDTIQRVDADGTQTAIAQAQTGSGFSGEGAVAVDAGHVYWLGDGPVEKGATPTMGFVRQSDPDGTGVLDLASGQMSPHTLLVDGGMVYWAEQGSLTSQGDFEPDGTVRRTPIGGGAVDTLATSLATPAVLARRGTDLWLSAGGDLVRLPDGGKPEVFYPGGGQAVIGVSHAYIVSTVGPQQILLRLPLAGGCAEPVADLGQGNVELAPPLMAADDENVYLAVETGVVVLVPQ